MACYEVGMRRALVILGLALLAIVVFACGASRSGFDGAGGEDGGGAFGDGSGDEVEVPRPPVIGWLHGKVFAPEGTVPVSEAMVYLTTREPDAIPPKVYCDTCVRLTPLEPYAYTKSDGSFELAAYAAGPQKLVVQKGQFRRIRDVVVTAGDQNIPGDLTRLPGKTDTAHGDTIPRIAMAVGGYDHIDASLKKLGIEEFWRYGDVPFPIPGLPAPGGIATNKSSEALLGNVSELVGYHIALLPCAALGASRSDDDGWSCDGPTATEKDALSRYANAGGKVYVTDFAYEAVRQTWPGFITFLDADDQPLDDFASGVGTGCRSGGEDTQGTPQDKGLAAWLGAIGSPHPGLKASWSRMSKVNPQPGYDPDGNAVTIKPKVWMTSSINGQELPATVSFEQRCGRVLFSTYHCEGDDATALLPQEKALLYILLEVSVCVGTLPPPPPPR